MEKAAGSRHLLLLLLLSQTACLLGPDKQTENGKAESETELGKLDLQLTYLWRVHGIDYYTGKEFADPTQFKLRVETTRTLRGPRPEDGEKPSEAEGLFPPGLLLCGLLAGYQETVCKTFQFVRIYRKSGNSLYDVEQVV